MTIESEGCPESAPSAAADAQGRATAMPHHYLLVAAALALSIGVSVLLLAFPEPIDRLGGLGYAGAFLVMAVNNATILLPSLGHAFIVAAAQTLNPFLLGIAGGIGGGLGELTGYALGKAGYNVMGHYRAMQNDTPLFARGSTSVRCSSSSQPRRCQWMWPESWQAHRITTSGDSCYGLGLGRW